MVFFRSRSAAAEGAATRAIGRALGCTTGTASKWRVRYAEHRLAGFSEVGGRGAAPKYDGETDRRILALLNHKPPPTHASWLNQVELWFSILSSKSLNDASFQSVPELIVHIEAFIASYNEPARPFVWTKSEVHQKRLKPCFAEQ